MIRIQNIYYMLAYAFKLLQEQGYKACATEEFENTADLLSAILVKGVTVQIKRGLYCTYDEKTDSIRSLRGKIDLSESIRQQYYIKRHMVCNFDEFTANSYVNRILKTTMQILLQGNIPHARKKELRNLLFDFKDVQALDIHKIDWNFRLCRNNRHYQLLIYICYLIIKGLLQTTVDGAVMLMDVFDEQHMSRLYEKFILEYYRRHYPQVNISSSQIRWALDNDIDEMLPAMRSDIMLSYGENVLIIDAKYYSHPTQTHYNTNSLYSNNLYQIFTYVKNKAAFGGNVSGLLLYAKTDEQIQPNNSYMMSGNQISVKTLDLDADFTKIKYQLNSIADEFLRDSARVL